MQYVPRTVTRSSQMQRDDDYVDVIVELEVVEVDEWVEMRMQVDVDIF